MAPASLPKPLRPLRARRNARGLTRFELLLGVSALGVTGAFVGAWQLAGATTNSHVEAEKRGKAVLSAASDWKRTHAQTGCPSITQLQRDDVLDRKARAEDPWGQRYRILCTSDEIQVRSAGGDGLFETADDITLAATPNS